jgi:hypothetical protein
VELLLGFGYSAKPAEVVGDLVARGVGVPA